jgi:hypothetical protein
VRCRLSRARATGQVADSGVEEAARLARYAALGRLCRQHGARLLLTAHHLDDQAETVCCNCCAAAAWRACPAWMLQCRAGPAGRSDTWWRGLAGHHSLATGVLAHGSAAGLDRG